MHISITDSQNIVTPENRAFAKRRLLFALSRFDSRIKGVELMVGDNNGPRGGIDKLCRVTVKLRRLTEVYVSDIDADLLTAISRAANRIGRVVTRTIERSQKFDRRRSNTVYRQQPALQQKR